ncbi:MAG: hypothetical protein N2327_00355 [Caldimicrobium sp.]|nr:hypothetical protein [Caldimicrobium sp.]MCX7872879.1 hypothetical protein [Caldimicrobium sp.]MDW8093543.1 hypothetical protein [Caldimicrobium sp.]
MLNYKKKTRGSVLFVAIVFSLMGLILIAGLFMAYQRTFRVIFPIKTYTTVREAVSGTTLLLASYIDNRYFEDLILGQCRNGSIKYRLTGVTNFFEAHWKVCLVSANLQQNPRIYIYSLTTNSSGPRGVFSSIEALYRLER